GHGSEAAEPVEVDTENGRHGRQPERHPDRLAGEEGRRRGHTGPASGRRPDHEQPEHADGAGRPHQHAVCPRREGPPEGATKGPGCTARGGQPDPAMSASITCRTTGAATTDPNPASSTTATTTKRGAA